jgi:hypothetical protein
MMELRTERDLLASAAERARRFHSSHVTPRENNAGPEKVPASTSTPPRRRVILRRPVLGGSTISLAATCVLAFFTVVPAQQAPATTPPLVRIDALGPAAWRGRFLPTNLGSLLASAEGEKLLRPLIDEFDALWAKAAGAEQQAARARFLEFGGRVRVGLWADTVVDKRPSMYGVLAIENARPPEAEAIVADLTRWLQILPERTEQEIGEQKFTIARNDDVVCTVPKLMDGRVVALFAERANELAAAGRQGLPWLAAPVPAPAPPVALRMSVDLARVLAFDSGPAREPEFTPLGFASLAELVFTLTVDGPHVRADIELGFKAGERGLFAALFPERAGVPALGDLVPEGTTGWKVGRCDALALWRAGMCASAVGRGKSEETVLADAKTECNGVDVGAQILGLLRDEVLVAWRDVSTEVPGGKRLSLCLAMPTTDEKAVRAAMAQMVATSDMEVSEADGVWRAMEDAGWLFTG